MSDFDFEAALAAQVAASRQETPETEPVADEQPETEEPEAEAEETPEVEDDTPEEEEPEDPDEPQGFSDPRITDYLSRYGGDVEKALQAAIEAQSLIGRQGSELGELRKVVEQMQERMDRPQQAPLTDLSEKLEEAPWEVVLYAAEQGDQRLHEQALEAWYESDPRSAARYEREIEFNMLRAEFEQKLSPIAEPVAQDNTKRLIAQASAQLAETYADFQDVIDSVTQEELDGLPTGTLEVLQRGDLNGKRQALEVTYRWVKAGRSLQAPAPPAAPAQNREAKKKATVATASARPAQGGESAVMDSLKEYMLTPEPHSVRHGLTE